MPWLNPCKIILPLIHQYGKKNVFVHYKLLIVH